MQAVLYASAATHAMLYSSAVALAGLLEIMVTEFKSLSTGRPVFGSIMCE